MCVRSFQLSDYSPVSALLEDVLCVECYDETLEALGRQLSWDGQMILVAEEEEEVVGVAIGTIDNGQGVLYRMVVSDKHRGKGIGQQLIDGLKQRFETRRVKKMVVNIDAHDDRLATYYESIGYQETDFMRSASKLSIVKKVAY